MLIQLGNAFDRFGIFFPFFVKARLILQGLAIENYGCDDVVPDSIVEEWKAWFELLDTLLDVSLARYYFEGFISVSPKVTSFISCIAFRMLRILLMDL